RPLHLANRNDSRRAHLFTGETSVLIVNKRRSIMRTTSFIITVMALAVLLTLPASGVGRATAADENSIVFKTSIQVTTAQRKSVEGTDGMWYDNCWHGAPRSKLNVQGPLRGGSQMSTEFFLPGNNPWVRYDCQTPDLAAAQIGRIECGYGLSEREMK